MMKEPVDRHEVFGEQADAVERIAPGYFRAAFEAEHLARYRWAARWVRGAVVLDVACGTGYGAPILRESGARRVVSADLSHDALRFGLGRYDLGAVQANAVGLPFRSRVFDAVVSLETVEHVSDAIGFLEEVRRVLRDGGLLLLSTPNRSLSTGGNPYHVQEFTLNELRRLLKAAGFELSSVWGQHWRLKAGVFRRVWGLRGLAWRLEHHPGIRRFGPSGSEPGVWCVSAISSPWNGSPEGRRQA